MRSLWKCAFAAAAVFVACFSLLDVAHTSSASTVYSPSQRRQIEEITRAYLRTHPEVLRQALAALESLKQQAADNKFREQVKVRAKELFDDPASPVLGNPNGDVTIVEFLDYRCPYCKKIEATLQEVIKRDKNLRLVQKQLPILGPPSVFAARLTLIAAQVGKHTEFHDAMIARTGNITENTVVAVAESIGINVDDIKQRIGDPGITATIKRDIVLAQELGLHATPSFVIGGEIVSGALDAATLLEMIDEARIAAK
jgi:protein-disulfide isomerase